MSTTSHLPKTDWSNWVKFFEDMTQGKVPHSSTGWYIVNDRRIHPRKSNVETKIKLVTPVGQTLEQAKMDLKEEKEEKMNDSDSISIPDIRRKRKKKATDYPGKKVKKKKAKTIGAPGVS